MEAIQTRQIPTICSYCGTGCGLIVHATEDRILKVEGNKNSRSSHGETCVKGSQGWGYVHSEKRLTHPMIRKNDKLVRTSWDEAFQYIAEKFKSLKSAYGQHSLAMFSSSRSTNELNYLGQKLMRQVIGTNNVDSCNRP